MNRSIQFRVLLVLALIPFLHGCTSKPEIQVDSIFYNGTVYTVDSSFSVQSALAIKDGKIVGIGSDDDILSTFYSTHVFDLNQKIVYPGLIDAHSHFYGFGKNMQELNLKNATSLEDVINKTITYAQSTTPAVIVGRGWNEENWITKGNISNTKLNLLFPTIPVVLQRIDGHAILCNQAALDLAGIDEDFYIEGGIAIKMGGYLTGLLVDQAAQIVLDRLPELSLAQKAKALKDAEQACFAVGLTTVTDAGLDEQTILLIDSLQRMGELSIRIYVMANPDTFAVTRLLKNKSITNNPLLNLRSIKLYGDGSLGSRGALLKHVYCDDSTTFGLIQHSPEYFKALIDYGYRNNLQVNTHCIGDSANKILLNLYADRLGGKNDYRWRIEHAQLVDTADLSMFSNFNIIPSIQPTHATSDAKMAKSRLCDLPSMNNAYLYNTLLKETGLVAFGTDFPVEDIDPISTFFAAVKRKTKDGNVFKPEEAIAPIEALRAMTIWAAYAGFMEDEIGSLEIGKTADLTIVSEDIISAYERGRIHNVMTVQSGKVVYTTGLLQPQVSD